MDILSNIENEFNNMNEIRDQLFNVIDVAVPAPRAKEGVEFQDPKTQLIYTDKGKYLGTVGDTYRSIQPSDFLDTIENSVYNTDFDLSKLSYKERMNGKIISFKLPTNIVAFKNRAGKQEEIELFLNFETGFGGVARTEIGLYSHRFICTNGMKIIDSEVQVGFKHTTNMNLKAINFTEEIMLVASRVQETKKVWKNLDSIEVLSNTEENFKRNLLAIKQNDKFADLSTKKQNIYNSLSESIALEFSRTGATAFGLLQGATHYTNHVATGNNGGIDGDFINVANGRKLNDKAQKLVLEMV